ncbi:hypothetical protein HanPSC8_Chr15g0648041 [Helianthus annuus]|nr:hypothetical protein HanPSC8_Chr15g0648041 [Helianthus annuus]
MIHPFHLLASYPALNLVFFFNFCFNYVSLLTSYLASATVLGVPYILYIHNIFLCAPN